MSDAYKSSAYLTGYGYVGGSDPTFPDFNIVLTNTDYQHVTTDNSAFVLTTNNPVNPSWNNEVHDLTLHNTSGFKFLAGTTYTIRVKFIYWTQDCYGHEYPNLQLFSRDNISSTGDYEGSNIVGQLSNITFDNGDILINWSNWSTGNSGGNTISYCTFELEIYFTPDVDTVEAKILNCFKVGSGTNPTNCDYYIAFASYTCSPEPTFVRPQTYDYTDYAVIEATVDSSTTVHFSSDVRMHVKQLLSASDTLDISNYTVSIKSPYVFDDDQDYYVELILHFNYSAWNGTSGFTSYTGTDTDNISDTLSSTETSHDWFNVDTTHEINWEISREGANPDSTLEVKLYSELKSVNNVLDTLIWKLTSFSSDYTGATFPMDVTCDLISFRITPAPDDEPTPPEPPIPPEPPTPTPDIDMTNIYHQVAHLANEEEIAIYESGDTHPYLFRNVDTELEDKEIPAGKQLQYSTEYQFLISGVISYRVKDTDYHNEESEDCEIP